MRYLLIPFMIGFIWFVSVYIGARILYWVVKYVREVRSPMVEKALVRREKILLVICRPMVYIISPLVLCRVVLYDNIVLPLVYLAHFHKTIGVLVWLFEHTLFRIPGNTR